MINTTPLRKKLLDLAFSGKLVPKTGEWKTVKLGEVADVQLGKRICKRTDSGRPYKFLANINVRWGCFDLSNLKETLFNEKEVEQFTLRKGDLLVCEGGDPGRCAIWEEDCSDIKYQMALHCIRPKECVTSEYLRYYFEAIHDSQAFRANFIGCTIWHLTKEIIVKLSIPLPPLSEQRAIVSRLEELLALEKSIAEDAAAIDDLISAAKRKILDLAVAGKLVKKRGEWKMVKGREIFLDTETRLPKGDYFDYIDIDAIDNKRHRIVAPKHIAVKDAPSRASRGVRAGDTLFSIVRPYLENIAYVDEEFSDCIASTGFFVCRPISDCDGRYLYWMMVSPKIVGGLNRFMKGDNSPSIRKGDIMSFDFPLPPLAEQRAIVAKVEELFAVLDAMKEP